MGYAIAEAARQRGAEVVLVSGPTNLQFPNSVQVRTTEEMRRAVLQNAADAEVVIKAAAPLDFRPKVIAAQKIKKRASADLALQLEPTADILAELGSTKNGKVLVGFAAETERHIEHGLEKLKAKNLDLIVVNSVSGPDSAFDSDMNKATLIDASGRSEEIPLVSKREMADKILDRVVQMLASGAANSPARRGR
jgi:phosphopantothenoylcysteine decarboxylase/phosphopantothenate--cysteine ligase